MVLLEIKKGFLVVSFSDFLEQKFKLIIFWFCYWKIVRFEHSFLCEAEESFIRNAIPFDSIRFNKPGIMTNTFFFSRVLKKLFESLV